MIHAYFNIRLDDAFLPERTGQLVQDAEEARAVARTIIRRLVVQHGGEPRLLNAVMAVTDADGAGILDLSFFEALYVPVAAPERAGAERPRSGLRGQVAGRVAATFGGRAAAAFAGLAARMRALPAHPRLAEALPRLRAHLAAASDLLSFRRDPRQRFTLQIEPGR